MSDRDRIAELMGWTFTTVDTTDEAPTGVVQQSTNFWIDPKGVYHRNDKNLRLPDPENDANDCEALIEHLNAEGWQVEVHWQFTNSEQLAAGAFIHIWNTHSEIHERTDIDVDRWKQGVCKLALRLTVEDQGNG